MGWHVLRLATLLCKQRVVGSIPTRSTGTIIDFYRVNLAYGTSSIYRDYINNPLVIRIFCFFSGSFAAFFITPGSNFVDFSHHSTSINFLIWKCQILFVCLCCNGSVKPLTNFQVAFLDFPVT
jgi:hypothetical protein